MIRTIKYIVENSGAWLDSSEANKANCVVKFKELDEEILFTAIRDDIYDHSKTVLSMLLAGDGGEVKSFAVFSAEERERERVQFASTYKAITKRILELSPNANIPTDADFNRDGLITLDELLRFLQSLEGEAFNNKYL